MISPRLRAGRPAMPAASAATGVPCRRPEPAGPTSRPGAGYASPSRVNQRPVRSPVPGRCGRRV